jgi:hypothetical protein
MKVVPVHPGVAPPQKLGEAGQSLWDRIQHDYVIADEAGRELLSQAALAADMARTLEQAIERDGPTIATNSGVRSNPAVRDLLQQRSFIVRTLQRLGVTDEAIQAVGRRRGR